MAKGDKRKRGRPRKDGPRDKSDRLIQPGKFTAPPEHILARRKLFSFVTPSKGPDGRSGEIDQDVCDGIGQLHALGLLDGHGLDPQDMRDRAREWRNLYVKWLRGSSAKSGGMERTDGTTPKDLFYADALSPMEWERFDKLDRGPQPFERKALLSLLVDPIVGSWPLGEEEAPWVRSVIGEALLKRKKIVAMVGFPGAHEHALLATAIRGICSLVDASLPGRYERRAA